MEEEIRFITKNPNTTVHNIATRESKFYVMFVGGDTVHILHSLKHLCKGLRL